MTTQTKDPIEVSFGAVTGAQRQKNGDVLQPVLTDLIAFGLTVKQLHWNVTGVHFRSIHLHLDEIYADVLAAVDLVAERMTATGHSPTGTAGWVAKNTELSDPPTGFLRDDQVLLHAAQGARELAELIRSRMAQIEEADTVTADLLHGVVAGLEKHHWMLQAQRV